MTLEQVKEHFKNAEEVTDRYGDSVKMKIENIYKERGYFFADNHKGQGVILWTPLTGFAQITKYKKMKKKTEVSNELIKSYHKDACGEWKKRIEKDFPELFPKSELEVEKWYNYEDVYLVCFTDLSDLDNAKFYGFRNGSFIEGANFKAVNGTYEPNPATDEEVEKALIDEAERRGFKVGVKVITTGGYKSIITDGHNHKFRAKDNNFYFHNLRVFDNGKWATIIQPEKEIEVDGFTYVLKA